MRNYNPSLIELLKSDHKKLLLTYQEAKELFESNGDFDNISNKLDDLKSLLSMHLNFENSLLYSYLEEYYQDHSENLEFIKSSDKKMQDIAEVAIKFIKECSDFEVFSQRKEEFGKELNKIGDTLVKRIEFEESKLYTLYN